MAQLARQYEMSDVGLAKICKKHNIPRPPRGYWAKKSAGIDVKQDPLPEKKRNETITIHPNPSYGVANSQNASFQKYLPENDIGPVSVAKRLANPHPLIEQASILIGNSKPDNNGLLAPESNNCIDIKVSKNTLPRALRIMDALVKCLIELKFEVYISKGKTIVNIDGIKLEFGIREELKTEQKPQKPEIEGYYRFNHSRFNQIKVPSGNLCISMHDVYSGGGLQKNWRDTSRKNIEDSLEKTVKGLIKLAAWEKEKIREREEWERQRQAMMEKREAEKKRREDLQRKISQEKERVSALIENAENWQKSKLVREFMAAVERQLAIGQCYYEPDCDWDEWFQWARDQADRLDPLTPSPPSIVDEDIDAVENNRDSDIDSPFYFR